MAEAGDPATQATAEQLSSSTQLHSLETLSQDVSRSNEEHQDQSAAALRTEGSVTDEDNNDDDECDTAIKSNAITVQFSEGEPEIFVAVRRNYRGRIKQLVQNGHNVNQVCKSEANARATTVDARIATADERVTIKTIQMTGYTPLHIAVIHSELQTIRLLISLGADVNARDKNARTPLQIAASMGRYRVASLLLEFGADVNTQSSSLKTPLFEAIIMERFDLVQLLLEHGADPNLADIKGIPPLSKAVTQAAAPLGQTVMPPIIQALLDAGCEVDRTSPGGATALMLCAQMLRNAFVIHMLVKAGANVNKMDSAGNTVFNLCASQGQGNLASVKAMMHYGAATHVPNNKGETPLSKCLKYGSTNLLRHLLSTDAVPHAPEVLTAPRILQVRKMVPDFDAFLQEEYFQPRSLLRLCREVVRNALSPHHLAAVHSLELPRTLCCFVLGDL